MESISGSTLKRADSFERIVRCDEEGNMCTVPSVAGLPYQFFVSSNGDGTGIVDLIGDYSGAITSFWYTATTRYEVHSVLINISDNANFNQADYGAIPGGLTNGIRFYVGMPKGVTEVPLLSTSTKPIKTNYQWLTLSPEGILTSFAGLAQTFVIEINLIHQYGKPLTLLPNQSFIVKLNDNFSTLVEHTIGLRGIKFDT